MYEIKIIAKEELESILPFLEWLNPDTELTILIDRLNEVRATNYQSVGVYDNEKLIAVSGIWILYKIYVGKHIEPDNIMVHPGYRNKGVGDLLMNWIHNYALEIGCRSSELNSRVTNHRGHKFFMQLGYEIIGYHFIKKLK